MAFAPSVWPLADALPDVEPIMAPEPHLPVFPKEKAPVLTPMPEIKAAE
jgi:hypothetical protein